MKTKLLLAGALLAMSSCAEDPMKNCVARGTHVLTPNGPRPIEDLLVGDAVYSVDEQTGDLVETVVTDIRSSFREAGRLSLGGTKLVMTSDHPVYCPDEGVYAPAGDWLLGNRRELAVVTNNGIVATPVEQREIYVGMFEVFDITVEHELHNFVANGILVHNKSQSEATCELNGATVRDGEPCGGCTTGSGRVDCTVPRCFCVRNVEPDPDSGTVEPAALFESCELDPMSEDPAVATCGRDDAVAGRSCTVDNFEACETTTCARHDGSEPFCTQLCTDDSECEGGTCLEFVFQSERKYCIAP